MTTTNQHGGKRPGAGRKPEGEQPRTVTRSVKLTADEAAYVSEFGTGELWRLLQASRHFQEWQQKRRS